MEEQEVANSHVETRAAATPEYYDKIKNGELRDKTKFEKQIETAPGHPDNESVQAARKRLEKQEGTMIDKDSMINYFHKYYSLEKAKVSHSIDQFGLKVLLEDPTLMGMTPLQVIRFKEAIAICSNYNEIMSEGGQPNV